MEQNAELEEYVMLVADGRQFTCSKRKLIEKSNYFRVMFTSNFSERNKDVIQLQDIDADCLDMLIQYVKKGTYSINEDNILPLLQTASMLQFDEVQLACEKEVCETLSCESCLDIYSVTSSLGLSQIARAARTIALWNFQKIVTTPQYCQLSCDALVEYLSDPALFTGPNGEWRVWEAIITWIEENEQERLCQIMQLLRCLDFKALKSDDISNMLFFTVVSENDEVVQLLEGIKKCKSHKIQTSDHTENDAITDQNIDSGNHEGDKLNINVNFYLNCVTRRPSLAPSMVGFRKLHSKRIKKAKTSDDEEDLMDNLPSRQNQDLVPVLYTYNPKSGKISEEFLLTKLCNGPVLCSGFQACSVGPSVYILGGEFLYGHGKWNDSLWRYSTVTRKWFVENSLLEPRRHHMICVLDSIIYILGGVGRHRIVLSSVRAYDTESGEWVRCPDMPHCVNNGAVCAFKGRLMVFTHEMQLLTYYPSMKKWSAIPLRSPSKHGYRAALPWGNFIYLIDNCTYKVYKYSPENGQTVREYGFFLSPPVNVCVVDGQIYNFSHDDLDNHVIEVLDIADEDGTSSQDTHTCDNQAVVDSVCDNSKAVMEIEILGNMENNTDSESLDKQDKGMMRDTDKSQLLVAKRIWKEHDMGPHIFAKCPADVTFSLGCFPLMKLM